MGKWCDFNTELQNLGRVRVGHPVEVPKVHGNCGAWLGPHCVGMPGHRRGWRCSV